MNRTVENINIDIDIVHTQFRQTTAEYNRLMEMYEEFINDKLFEEKAKSLNLELEHVNITKADPKLGILLCGEINKLKENKSDFLKLKGSIKTIADKLQADIKSLNNSLQQLKPNEQRQALKLIAEKFINSAQAKSNTETTNQEIKNLVEIAVEINNQKDNLIKQIKKITVLMLKQMKNNAQENQQTSTNIVANECHFRDFLSGIDYVVDNINLTTSFLWHLVDQPNYFYFVCQEYKKYFSDFNTICSTLSTDIQEKVDDIKNFMAENGLIEKSTRDIVEASKNTKDLNDWQKLIYQLEKKYININQYYHFLSSEYSKISLKLKELSYGFERSSEFQLLYMILDMFDVSQLWTYGQKGCYYFKLEDKKTINAICHHLRETQRLFYILKKAAFYFKHQIKTDELITQINHLKSSLDKDKIPNTFDKSLTNINTMKEGLSVAELADIANQLQADNKITRLYLNLNKIKPRDLRRLLPILDQKSSLQKLNLSYSTYQMPTNNKNLLLNLIFDFLKNNAYLSQINLSGNPLDDEQCQNLAEAIKSNKVLKTLCLSSANISSQGMEYIISSLEQNHSLDTLIINGNNEFLAQNAASLIEVLKKNKNIIEIALPELNCTLNFLTTCYPYHYRKIEKKLTANKELKHQLVEALQAGSAQKLIQILKKNPNFISFKDENYNNLAHLAVLECDVQLLAIVLQRMKGKINPLVANQNGQTPLDIARELKLGAQIELLKQYHPTLYIKKFIDQWFLANYPKQKTNYDAKLHTEVMTRELARKTIHSRIEEDSNIQSIEIPEWAESHKHEFRTQVDKTSSMRCSVSDTIEIAKDKSLSHTYTDSCSWSYDDSLTIDKQYSYSSSNTFEAGVSGSVSIGVNGLFVQTSTNVSANIGFNQVNSNTQNTVISSSSNIHKTHELTTSDTRSSSERHSFSLSKDQTDEMVNSYSETLSQEIIVQPDMRYEFIANKEIKKQRIEFKIAVKLKGDVHFSIKESTTPANYDQKVSIQEIFGYFKAQNKLPSNVLIRANGIMFNTFGEMEVSSTNYIALVRICPYWKLRYLVAEIGHDILKTHNSWQVIPIIKKDSTGTVVKELSLACKNNSENESALLTDVLKTTLINILGEKNVAFTHNKDGFSYIDIKFVDLKASRELLEGLTFVVFQQYFLEQLRFRETQMLSILAKQAAKLILAAAQDIIPDKAKAKSKYLSTKLFFKQSEAFYEPKLVHVFKLFFIDNFSQELIFTEPSLVNENHFELDLARLGVENLLILNNLNAIDISNRLAKYYQIILTTRKLEKYLNSTTSLHTGIYNEFLEVRQIHPKKSAEEFGLIKNIFSSDTHPIKSITEDHFLIPIENITRLNIKLFCNQYQAIEQDNHNYQPGPRNA